MSISYEEALATLEAMFGDPWTRETLDAVLRHHKGHMENTVDQILRYGDQDPVALVDQLAAGINPDEVAAQQDAILARQLQGEQAEAVSRRRVVSTSVGSNQGRGTPTVLPDDFLRLPSSGASVTASGSATASATPESQLDSDAALARMLQDELFTQELARNPDFAHLARGSSTAAGDNNNNGGRATRTNSDRRVAEQNSNRGGQQVNNNNNNNNNPMPAVMGKISELGDNAKRRLQIMAAQFNANRAKQTGSSSGGDHGGASSPAAAERRGLLDDNDDMEMAARKDL